MTLVVRAIIELFRLVGREKELYQEILAFSILYNNSLVRIYGHYPMINGKDTTYYYHLIHNFVFIELDGKDKWAAYKFTKNVYDIWMPTHFKRIYLVINQVPPDINFEVSKLQSLEASRLSQVLEDQSLSQLSNPNITSLARNDDS
jgi:hypothetical protein